MAHDFLTNSHVLKEKTLTLGFVHPEPVSHNKNIYIFIYINQTFEFLPATGGRLGGRAPGGGTGGRRFTGGGFMRGGGGGSPGGGGASTPGIGGGWKGSMLGRLTSSTTTGSLPWSKGHMSPRMQKPFSGKHSRHVNNTTHTHTPTAGGEDDLLT